MAKKGKFKIIECVKCGFKHLNPIPSAEELSKFYQKKYYAGVRDAGIRRLMFGGKDATLEREWLHRTVYSDMQHVLETHIHKKSKYLLDVGCGIGEFLKYMKKEGWTVTGIEPGEEATNIAMKSRLTVYNTTLEDFIKKNPDFKHTFDAITLLNVLEHVPDPKEILKMSRTLLNPRTGMICVRVPNDFYEFQIHAERKLKKTGWWLAIPDHINYFNLKSLQKLVESAGFRVVHKTADFPMELFLLFGDDYTRDSKLGSLCHKKRVSFELAIPDTLRQEIYRCLAGLGLGRVCTVYAKFKNR